MYYQELCSTTELGQVKRLSQQKSQEMNHFALIDSKLSGKVYETIDQFYGDLQYLCNDVMQNGTSPKYNISPSCLPNAAQMQKIQANIDTMYENYLQSTGINVSSNSITHNSLSMF